MSATLGKPAPDLWLVSQTGERVRLESFRGGAVVVYFFPKAFTPACSLEACAFRDATETFDAFASVEAGGAGGAEGGTAGLAGATILGVSPDSPETLRAFSKRFSLPFQLLSDADGAARAAWGVPRTLGLFPGRVTYVLDKNLVVRHVFSSQLRPSAHVRQAKQALAAMKTE